ncbi:MAG TPA: acyl-CoA dehydrogenase [Cytophagales bacterium]|nr:acyl-CoA dehydrogenase [Cytophagales bacterium]HAA18746.1 acyl-CoA dehydrogenase [Cytophagales bacterium]HAP63142.1 acyl-CoA dehydrogenase [Cytophagales bacterium]
MIQGWTTEQAKRKAYFAQWAKEHIAPGYANHYASRKFNESAWAALCQTEFWRIPIPTDQDGLGRTWWDFTAALEGLATGGPDVGFLLTCVAQAGFLSGLLQTGTPVQQQLFIPKLLSGTLSAIGIAEPQSGTDVPGTQTKASATPDGYTLNGHKWHLAHGNTAGLLLTVAKLDDTVGLTCFLTNTDLSGVSPGTPFQTLGLRTLPIASVGLEEVQLSADALFGEPGQGLPVLGSAVGLARVYYGLVCACILEQALRQTWSFLEPRISFGKPILKHQHVQQKLTEVQIGIDQARWSAYGALHALLSNQPEAIRLGSQAKWTGTQALIAGTQHLMSLLSSHGYQEDHWVAHWSQDALGILSVGGTEETHRINIFNQMNRIFKSSNR